MFTVEVDLVLRYVPPMSDQGPGIRLTRTIDLPFPPVENISVFSKDWEGTDDPLGYILKQVTWDMDRKRFLAETAISVTGTPIAMIPFEIHELVGHGWRVGSYQDGYRTDRKRGRKRSKLPRISVHEWDWDEAEAWDSDPKGRPKEFKLLLQGIVSTMAELHNNCSIAYAMLKTGRFVEVTDRGTPTELSSQERRFRDATREFESFASDRQWDWAERVKRRYPQLADIAKAIE
jgi:hypothetical protein